jgi:mRNA interferase MazF
MDKVRPTVIVQADRVTRITRGTVLIAPLSSDIRPRPIEQLGIKLVRIQPRGGLTQTSVILIDQLRAISPQRLMSPGVLTTLTAQEMAEVQDGIRQFL